MGIKNIQSSLCSSAAVAGSEDLQYLMNLVQKPLVMVMMLMMSLMMLMTLMMFTMTSMLYLYCTPICISPRYLHDDRMISDTMLLEHWMECIMARPLGCCCVTEIVLRGQPAVCSMSFVPPRAGNLFPLFPMERDRLWRQGGSSRICDLLPPRWSSAVWA